MEKNNYNELFTKSIIKTGKFTSYLGVICCFLPAIMVYFKYGEFPGFSLLLQGTLVMISLFGVYWVIEPISFFPVLGLPGTYMSFITGNIKEIRLPASSIAQEALGTKLGSKKGELVSTISIAGSIIASLSIITLAAMGGAALMKIFPPIVIEAFKYVSPSIFGAVFAMNAEKNLTLGVFALALSLFMILVIKIIPAVLMMPINIFATVGLGIYLYKRKNNKTK